MNKTGVLHNEKDCCAGTWGAEAGELRNQYKDSDVRQKTVVRVLIRV